MNLVKAAIREPNGTIYVGTRHADIIRLAIRLGMMEDFEEGFMTDEGNFVDRSKAAKIALESGQIKIPVAILHSEELWPD